MNEEDKKALQKGLSAAARKLKKQEEERAKTAKERAEDLAFQQAKAAATATRSSSELGGRIERPKSKDTRMPATGKKKKTTSEFRNGGVVDLGDFKGSF
tara:strand:- start:643 stop:939 length:297 start_codon:yes stop_codon:yes gene_type:complete